MKLKQCCTWTILIAALLLWAAPAMADGKSQKASFPHNPVIFVHGSSGSASQFESQAMRFAGNGYPETTYTPTSMTRPSPSTPGPTCTPAWMP